jgi:nucleoside-diphosphate-sugar epimerase
MKLLIVGGTGNISTAITRALQGKGLELTLFNHDADRPSWLDPSVRVLTGNRKDFASLEQRVAECGPFDCVVDMLCFDPEDAESDVRAFRGRTRQLVLCSTVDVYGKTPASYPVREDSPLGARPSFPYGYKKMRCEEILWAAHQRGDFALTVLRPTFTYNETWSPGIHAFGGQSYHLDRLLKGKPIILHGDGTSIWVATYRDDTAGAFVGAIGNEKALGQAYNVTGEEWMTHHHIWCTIARILDAPPPDFVYIPTDLLGRLAPKEAEWCVENFQYSNLFDNTKAKRDLGFVYRVKFEDGARKCIQWLRANNRIEDCAKYPFYDRIVDLWRGQERWMVEAMQAGDRL